MQHKCVDENKAAWNEELKTRPNIKLTDVCKERGSPHYDYMPYGFEYSGNDDLHPGTQGGSQILARIVFSYTQQQIVGIKEGIEVAMQDCDDEKITKVWDDWGKGKEKDLKKVTKVNKVKKVKSRESAPEQKEEVILLDKQRKYPIYHMTGSMVRNHGIKLMFKSIIEVSRVVNDEDMELLQQKWMNTLSAAWFVVVLNYCENMQIKNKHAFIEFQSILNGIDANQNVNEMNNDYNGNNNNNNDNSIQNNDNDNASDDESGATAKKWKRQFKFNIFAFRPDLETLSNNEQITRYEDNGKISLFLWSKILLAWVCFCVYSLESLLTV